jgi:hypothetical protein
MSASIDRSSEYTETGENTRAKALMVFGALTALEWMATGMDWRAKDCTRLMIVQEHQAALLPKGMLTARYPDGAYHMVPDVFPKRSGETVAARTGMREVVWNEDAYRELRSKGFDPLWIHPHLFSGYQEKPLPSLEDRIVIKSSGSGMPDEYKSKLLQALVQTRKPFAFYLPNLLYTHEGITMLPHSVRAKNTYFYNDLAAHPPRLLVSLTSEMVQVVSEIKMQNPDILHISFPARGPHEKRNANFAHAAGVTHAEMDPHLLTVGEMVDMLRAGLDTTPVLPDVERIGGYRPTLIETLGAV